MAALDSFALVTVSSTSYPGTAQHVLDLKKGTSQSLALLNKGTKKIRYSFDGAIDHGELDPADPSVGITFDNRRRTSIWFRLGDGETGSAIVRSEAWVSP